MSKERVIDNAYYQHSETARNMWFNYSDPYFYDNEDVKEYQKEIVEKEKQMDNNKNTKSNNVYQSSTKSSELQQEYVENLDNKDSNMSVEEANQYSAQNYKSNADKNAEDIGNAIASKNGQGQTDNSQQSAMPSPYQGQQYENQNTDCGCNNQKDKLENCQCEKQDCHCNDTKTQNNTRKPQNIKLNQSYYDTDFVVNDSKNRNSRMED